METYIIVAGFILSDILTGILQALHSGTLNSTKLREGLFHKLSEILALAFSMGVEYACNYMNFGIEVPIFSTVSIYICLMELVSVLENLCKINPALAKLFKRYFEKLNKDEEE